MKTKFYLVMASVLFLFSCTDDFIGEGSSIKRVVVCYYDAELDDYNTVTVTVEEAELMITYGAYLGVCEDEETDPTTAILDEAFEQELINLGYDDVLDGVVLTENISGVERLELLD